MIPTWIGMLMAVIGLGILLRGGLSMAMGFVMVAALFGGSAAVSLPALGGSSIAPAYFALGFLALGVAKLGRGALAAFGDALKVNASFVFFCVYGAATAFVLPKLFARQFDVVPMKAANLSYIFDTEPLRFTSQNITTAVYLIGSALAAMAASIAAAVPSGGRATFRIMIVATWGHAALGILVLLMQNLGLEAAVSVVRNGAYAQLVDAYQGFVRITGFFPEASAYAAFGFPLLVFCVEAWLRDVSPRLSGATALAAIGLFLLSTSGSAYVSLAGYGALLGLRWLVFPNAFGPEKTWKLALLGMIGLALGIAALVLTPQLASSLHDMITHMTLDKADSKSGLQRRFWAEQGLHLFSGTYGLGVGSGSFRSSSLLTAILGSTGVLGLISFTAYALAVFKPLRMGSYVTAHDLEYDVGACCAWAALAGLLPAMIASPSPDPGLEFAILAGAAMSLRALATARLAAQQRRPAMVRGFAPARRVSHET